MWHVFVEGLDTDVQYGYRFDMQPNPDPQIYRFDPEHVLARSVCARAVQRRGMGSFQPGSAPYRNSLMVENQF